MKVKVMMQDGTRLCGQCKEPIWKGEKYVNHYSVLYHIPVCFRKRCMTPAPSIAERIEAVVEAMHASHGWLLYENDLRDIAADCRKLAEKMRFPTTLHQCSSCGGGHNPRTDHIPRWADRLAARAMEEK